MSNIDFLIMWVDGSDEKWIKEKMSYQMDTEVPDEKVAYAAKCFRDWDNLQYWFRGVEKYAPWVHKIFFVTYGHLPKWLNKDNPKLRIINHKQFMPSDALPTYNSRALEINFNHIKDLSNEFVYFNDDMFLTKPVLESDFFENGIPKDCAILSPVVPARYGTGSIQVNDLEIVNQYFHDFDSLTKNKKKWITTRYGKQLARTFLLYPFHHIVGIYEPHLPASYLKKTYDKIWSLETPLLEETTRSRFKVKDNVNQWLIRYWQIMSGNFIPRSPNFGKYFDLSKSMENACDSIKRQKYHMICLNDSTDIKNFEDSKTKIKKAFDTILPDKSSYEL